MKNWIEKGAIGLLVVLNAMFLYYWGALAANYCMHYDDVHFMWKMQEYSIFEYVKEMYMSRGGDFAGYALNGVMFHVSNVIGAYRFWAILFYVLGIIMTWGAFRDLPYIKNSGYKGWLGVITLYNIYVLTSIDYAVFTWLCAMEYYLFAPALCLLVKYVSKETLSRRQKVLLVWIAIFISGNVVSISTVTFMVLFAYGMWMWQKEGWNVKNTWNKPQVKRLLGITALMLLCFVVVFVAPGNWNRLETGDDMQHPESLLEYGKAIVNCIVMFLYMTAFYLPYHLMAVVLGALAGIKYPVSIPIMRKNAILIVLILSFGYLLFSVLPLAYLSNGFGIQRNYTQISFFYMLTFFVIGYLLSNQRTDNINVSKWVNVSLSVSTLFLIVIMALNIHQDIPIAQAYNKAHQEREACLIALQEVGNKETIIVSPYPSTHTMDAKYFVLKLVGKRSPMQAIYYESDTEEKPNEYEYYIKKLLKLDFDFVLSESMK